MIDDALKHYQMCWFIRAFEAAIAAEAAAGITPGLVHLSTGSEVADVLLASKLDPARDQVTGSHRSHGIALACGAEPIDVAGEIMGLPGGLSDGQGGTQHLIAPEAGFLTSNGIVGAQVPLAAGAALTAKTKGNGGVGVAVFGDGAANQGAVLETMNMAVSLKLPMVFSLYNNGMAQSTAVETASGGNLLDRAKSFGLAVFSADSADYVECAKTLSRVVHAARDGMPAFVEVTVSRDHGHYYAGGLDGDDFEASTAMENLEKYLLKQNVDQNSIDSLKREACERATATIRHAKELAHA